MKNKKRSDKEDKHIFDKKQYFWMLKHLETTIENLSLDITAHHKMIRKLDINQKIILFSYILIDYYEKQKSENNIEPDFGDRGMIFIIESFIGFAYFQIRFENCGKIPADPFYDNYPELNENGEKVFFSTIKKIASEMSLS